MSSFNSEKARHFAVIKAKKEHAETMAKLYGSMLEELGRELFVQFTDSGVKSFRLSGAGVFDDGRDRMVYPMVKTHGTIVHPDKFFAYLRQTGNGTLIKSTVHPQSLTKWITLQKENNQPLPDETVLKVWQQETAKVTRAQGGVGKKSASVETEATEMETEIDVEGAE